MVRPTMLMILDGFGISDKTEGNAIAKADTPELDRIFNDYPSTTLKACGLDVGLPEGQMGNSEVGHLNIGAGRIVYQELTKITKHIGDGTFFTNRALVKAMNHVLTNRSSLHIMGLLSDGGVHSHIDHLKALLKMAKDNNIKNVYVHAFLDGRDVPPRCALKYISEIEDYMKENGVGRIATVSGRYYAMDRDKRWERLEKAYDAITLAEGMKASTAAEAVEKAYARDENDEFVLPTIVEPAVVLNDRDAVIMYNFRPDRAREITRSIVDENFSGFKRKKTVSDIRYVCMTQYDATMPAVDIAYPPEKMRNTLGEYLSDRGLVQLRIAETEKYAHVTFFFNGGVEEANPGESRILIDSPKVATYDLQPEMSAYKVTETVIEEIKKGSYDVIILNFANADMVGHTGVMDAAVSAIETLDKCVPQIEKAVLDAGGQILLTADHGNADEMVDDEGRTVTAHSLNDVPLVHIAKKPVALRDGGRLADIAPTLLSLMDISIPDEMTGKSLIK